MQTRAGRDGTKYNYARACIIRQRVSINGRAWKRATIFDYVSVNGRLAVGQVRDFVVVEYTHKDVAGKRGRVRPSTLEGTFVFVRARQYNPTPQHVLDMWEAPKRPTYHLRTRSISVMDLCSFLHRAPQRDGREGRVNLIKVATAFV
jgi:hypothetical protein